MEARNQEVKELRAQLDYIEDDENIQGYLSDGGKPTRKSTRNFNSFLAKAREHAKLDSPAKQVREVAKEVVRQLGGTCQVAKKG